MNRVIIWTGADMKKVQEVALGIEEIYRSGVRYKISEFISAFGGGTNRTPGKDDDFIIPGPYIDIESFENACSLMNTIIVYVWYKEEDVKMADAQDALIKEIEKNGKEQKSLIEELVEYNKDLKDENYRLLQERRQLTEKIMKLDDEAAKEKENKEFEKTYTKNLEEVNDRLRKAIERQDTNLQKDLESKEKDIQALMDQLDSRDREIRRLRDTIIEITMNLYFKKRNDK